MVPKRASFRLRERETRRAPPSPRFTALTTASCENQGAAPQTLVREYPETSGGKCAYTEADIKVLSRLAWPTVNAAVWGLLPRRPSAGLASERLDVANAGLR
jgi:hypothetical protein